MELELSRVDYTVTGLTSSKCMQLLPSSVPKQQQKVVLADNDGVLQVFSIKKQDIQLQFKTLPGSPITAVQCSGASGTALDKIFAASDTEVRGYTKKGKLFLNFNTNMTEPITSMFVYENDLILCGRHVYNHYRDCKDVGYYLCGDSILDVVAVLTDKNRRLTSVIACEGRMLRILEHSRVIHMVEITSSPVVLHVCTVNDEHHVLFGTVDGHIGLLNIERTHATYRWILENSENTSSISCIDTYDMTGDDTPNLIVGRQDGSIEVYAIDILQPTETPRLLYNFNCLEFVTSIQGGIVGNDGYVEILVSTYTGRIFGLTSEIIDKNFGTESDKESFTFSAETGQKIMRLKSENSELEAKVAREREKYQLTTQIMSVGVSAIPILPLKSNMILNSDDASYMLSLEAPTAIDNVLLQCNVGIDLLDVEKNSAVVSYSDCLPESGNFILVAYRCQVNTNRLEIKLRTIEGQYGRLQAYITPQVQPKCCQLKQFDIKPLSLHIRCNTADENRPYNTLTLKGSFSLAEMHSLVMKCFPEVPDKPQVAEKTSFIFQSIFTNTTVICTYSKSEAEFKSENISSIAILKEFLTKEATKKKIKLDVNYIINDSSIAYTLNLLHENLQKYKDIAKKKSLLEALHELEINENENLNYLTPKYKKLLREEKKIKRTLSKKPSYLERLHGVIQDLYVDYNKLKGHQVKGKIPQLLNIMEDYDFGKLLNLFLPSE